MKREDIEKAAFDYVQPLPFGEGFHDLDIERAFRAGAKWRINSVWHNSKTEVPDVNTIVLVEKEDGSIWQYKVFAKSQMMGLYQRLNTQ